MIEKAGITPAGEHAVSRLASLAPIEPAGLQALRAMHPERLVRSRRDILTEGAAIGEPFIILSGWAMRVRILIDGRRQILGFVLPGDLLGYRRQERPVALTALVALTDVTMASAPTSIQNGIETGLDRAYALSATLDEHYLLLQIVRLGRMNALERIADWLLELRERLGVGGHLVQDSIQLPLTQEIIADTLGLTSVHVNRTLQAMRREGLLELRGGTISFLNVERLQSLVQHRPPRLSA